LEGNSIRVDSTGAVVFDVIHSRYRYCQCLTSFDSFVPSEPAGTVDHTSPTDIHTNHNQAEHHSESILPDTSQQIAELREQKVSMTHELRIFEEQQDILKSYANSLTGSAVDSGALSQFLDLYGGRQLEHYSKRRALEGSVSRLRKEIEEAETAETKRNADRRLGTVVVIIVYAERDMKSDLELVYNVRDADWTPIYSLRVTIPDTGPMPAPADDKFRRQSSTTVATTTGEKIDRDQGLKATISLHYRASISQWTGEDWKNAQLVLRTASPQLGSIVPKMKSVRLSEAGVNLYRRPMH
jgi:hypothetical protein